MKNALEKVSVSLHSVSAILVFYSTFALPLFTTPDMPSEIYSISERLEILDVM